MRGAKRFHPYEQLAGSRIASHETVGLAGRASVGLSGEKEGERHDVLGALDPFASFLEDRAGPLGLLSDALGENRARDQLVHADIVLPELQGEHADEHGEPGLGRSVRRLARPTVTPQTRSCGYDLPCAPRLEVRYRRPRRVVGAYEV